MTDRRRINGPAGATIPPFFNDADLQEDKSVKGRSRAPDASRKMCMFLLFLLSEAWLTVVQFSRLG